MKKTTLALLFTIAILLITSVTTTSSAQRKKNTATFYDYEVECMGTGRDGTQLIKVWGYGRNVAKAIDQAKKNAVHAVIFRGIAAGKPGCMQRPLATRPGTEQQQSAYFDNFFADGGKHLNFVSITSDGSIDPKDRLKVGRQYKVGVIVSVMHAQLRKELEAAGVIQALGDGF
jgi:hypothetical protein